jgi:hypothetical protein
LQLTKVIISFSHYPFCMVLKGVIAMGFLTDFPDRSKGESYPNTFSTGFNAANSSPLYDAFLAPVVRAVDDYYNFSFTGPDDPADYQSSGGQLTPLNPRRTGMADNIYKLVLNFIESSGATWSEIYYRSASNAQAAASFTNAVVTNRLSILHPTSLWRNLRAFNVASNRDSYTVVLNYAGKYVDSSGAGPAASGAAAVCSFTVAAGRSTYHWLRGIPNALISNNAATGFPTPPAVLVAAIRQYAAALGNNGCGTRNISNVVNGKYQITNLTANSASNTVTISYSIAAGQAVPTWTNLSRVVISNASKKDLPGLNGHWSVVSVVNPTAVPGTGSVTIRYVLPNGATTIPCNGFIKLEGFSGVNPFVTGLLAYYGTHSTKSVFSNSRGAKHASRVRGLA